MRPLLTIEHTDPDPPVLVVTNMWPNAEDPSYGIFVKRQVDSLIAAGLRCDVLFIRGCRSPLAYPLAALLLLARNLRRRPYALVHAHAGETALAARAYLRAPVLVSYCGDDLLGTPGADGRVSLGHRVRRRLIRAHARLVSATVTKSSEMETKLAPAVRARNAVIPNGVPAGLFAPLERGEARRRLGWDERERVALFAGDPAVARKRYWLAAEAADRAAGRLEGVRLHVATGRPPGEVPILMSAADCLLHTSSIEGSPNVVKEALMCNLPVIATPAGDVRELLEPSDPSWLCPPEPGELATALVECLREPRRSNGREGAGRFGTEEIARRILALYAELAPAAVAGTSGSVAPCAA
jgi:teichuronic acid biosynthesis glycosyltransferase TuaC